jgi:hypothetical protein
LIDTIFSFVVPHGLYDIVERVLSPLGLGVGHTVYDQVRKEIVSSYTISYLLTNAHPSAPVIIDSNPAHLLGNVCTDSTPVVQTPILEPNVSVKSTFVRPFGLDSHEQREALMAARLRLDNEIKEKVKEIETSAIWTQLAEHLKLDYEPHPQGDGSILEWRRQKALMPKKNES